MHNQVGDHYNNQLCTYVYDVKSYNYYYINGTRKAKIEVFNVRSDRYEAKSLTVHCLRQASQNNVGVTITSHDHCTSMYNAGEGRRRSGYDLATLKFLFSKIIENKNDMP